MDFTKLKEKEKYEYLVGLLKKIQSDKLYKGEVIEGNETLKEQRQMDIDDLKDVISDEMRRDGIRFKFIQGIMLNQNGF